MKKHENLQDYSHILVQHNNVSCDHFIAVSKLPGMKISIYDEETCRSTRLFLYLGTTEQCKLWLFHRCIQINRSL